MKQPSGVLSLKVGAISTNSIHDFQVFGERCSGTNFVKTLIENNLDIKFRKQYGWKHGFPSMVATKPCSLAVAVFRNSENWLRSIHRRPWHVPEPLRSASFSDFIRAQWSTVVNKTEDFRLPNDSRYVNRVLLLDRDPISGEPFSNIIKLRNAKNHGFWGLKNRFDNVIFVRYEDVVLNQMEYVDFISGSFGLSIVDCAEPIETYKGRYEGRKFIEKKYHEISQSDADFIWSSIDIEMEEKLGYFRR